MDKAEADAGEEEAAGAAMLLAGVVSEECVWLRGSFTWMARRGTTRTAKPTSERRTSSMSAAD